MQIRKYVVKATNLRTLELVRIKETDEQVVVKLTGIIKCLWFLLASVGLAIGNNRYAITYH